jgi:exosortase E/protease (VPEID-CTERM system)
VRLDGRAARIGAPSPGAILRLAAPAALLLAEYLSLSLLVDFPTDGPALHVADGVRILVPVVFGAAVAGWLLEGGAAAFTATLAELPPWRPLLPLAAQLAAFAGTTALAQHLLGPGAPPLGPGALWAWLACVAATALLAVEAAVPLPWLLRRLGTRWHAPLLAVALGVLGWRAASAAEGLWSVASALTLRAVAALLRLVGAPEVDVAHRLVGLDGFTVDVAPVCSGVDGVGMVLIFQAMWIAMARERLRVGRALVLLPLGVAAALAANVLRISILVLAGASGHEALALGTFHSKLGWILFAAIALTSIAVAERWPWLQRARAGAPAAPPREAILLAPFLAALATALVTSMWTTGPLDPAYALRVLAAGGALAACRRELPSLRAPRPWPALLAGIAVGAAWCALSRGEAAPLREALFALGPGPRSAWIAARLVGAIAMAPLVEELAFRGFLLGWLLPRGPAADRPGWLRAWPAVLVSSIAFGALHPSFWLGAGAGVVFAAARLWRGRLGDAVLAHAAANGVLAAAVLLGGRFELWS